MTTRKLALVALLAAPLAAVGCGGDDTSVTADDMAMQVFKVQSGTYSVSAITKVSDTCNQNLSSANFPELGVTNDGHGTLSLGSNNQSTFSDPALYSNGTGMFSDSYHVTTKVETDVNATGCMYHLVRTNDVTVVGDNMLNVVYKQTQTMHMGTCTVVAVDCMGNYTFSLSKPVVP